MTAVAQPHRPRILVLPTWWVPNPYLDNLRGSLQSAGAEVIGWRQLGARRPPDAVLIHWQESHWVGRGLGPKRCAAALLLRRALLVILRSLRRRGSTVVWFAHNQVPHEWTGSAAEWISRSAEFFTEVDAVAHLSHAATTLPEFAHVQHLPSVVVRHPHYERVRPAEHAAKAQRIQRILLLGGLERRKNASDALRLISQTDDLTAVVTGQGRWTEPRLQSPRVQVVEGFLDDAALNSFFDGSTVVLLNQERQINSGVMYLALSRGAPVLCPDTPVNREIQSLVGAEWIRTFDVPLTTEQLRQLVAEPIPTTLPDLTPFDPDSLGEGLIRWLRSIRTEVTGSSDAEDGSVDSIRGSMDALKAAAENQSMGVTNHQVLQSDRTDNECKTIDVGGGHQA